MIYHLVTILCAWLTVVCFRQSVHYSNQRYRRWVKWQVGFWVFLVATIGVVALWQGWITNRGTP